MSLILDAADPEPPSSDSSTLPTANGEPDAHLQDAHLKAQKARGESSLKWWILLDVFAAWNSSWFTTFSAAALETTLIETLHWDSSQYSYITAATFGGAIIGPFLLPLFDWILTKTRGIPISSNHLSQMLLIIGQGTFAVLLQVYHEGKESQSAIYGLLLISRMIIGLGMGSADAKCQGTISYWFGASDRVNEAFGLLIIGIEIGMMMSRIAFPPFYYLFNEGNEPDAIALPFILALSIPIISMIISFFMERRVQTARTLYPEYFVESQEDDDDENAGSDAADSGLMASYSSFTATIWVTIVVVVLVMALITVLYSCFVDPLHETFELGEYHSDLLLSASGVMVITLQFPASWIMDYFGGAAYWIWAYCTSQMLSMAMLAFTATLSVHGVHVAGMQIYGICGIVLFSVMAPFENIYGLQAIASPPQHAQLIASTTTASVWALAIMVTNGFGWIRDETGDYSIALLLMFALSVLTWALTAILIVMDERVGGPLTKGTERGRNCLKSKTNTSDGEELEPLLRTDAGLTA